MRRRTLVFLLSMGLLATSGCVVAPAPAELAPVFDPRGVSGWESGGPGTAAPAALVLEFGLPEGGTLSVRDCDDVQALDPDDIASSEFHRLMRARVDCMATGMFDEAGVAERSFFAARELDDQLLWALPATVAPSPVGLGEAGDPGQTLFEAEQVETLYRNADGSWHTLGRDSAYAFTALAWGDFDGDGIDDVLLRVDWRALDAFGRASALVVLTRGSSAGPYTVVGRQEP